MIQHTDATLDCTRSVNDTVARFPETLAVFDKLGIDSCCGGGLSVEDAARRGEVDPAKLCGALEEAVRATRG